MQGQLLKWNDSFAEVAGEAVPFLHASDGSVLILQEQTKEVRESSNSLDLSFVLVVIQAYAQRDATLYVSPVSAVRHAGYWFKPGVWCAMTSGGVLWVREHAIGDP